MILIDGKKTSLEIQDEIKGEVTYLKSKGKKIPHLAAVLVGSDGGSLTYVNAKVKACDHIGFDSSLNGKVFLILELALFFERKE